MLSFYNILFGSLYCPSGPYPQGSLTVLNPDFVFEVRSLDSKLQNISQEFLFYTEQLRNTYFTLFSLLKTLHSATGSVVIGDMEAN